jgi:hypothetical protein
MFSHRTILLPACLALLVISTAVPAADPVQNDREPVLQLGTISVSGERKIVQTLRAIKAALHTPFSSDAAHANDVVCRINKPLGEAREYLDCATNRDYARRRDATQVSVAIGTLGVPGGADILRSFVSEQPQHQLHVPVQGGALQALLARVPDAPPAVTAVTPATATATP